MHLLNSNDMKDKIDFPFFTAEFHPAAPDYERAVEQSKVTLLNADALSECCYKSDIPSQQAVCV